MPTPIQPFHRHCYVLTGSTAQIYAAFSSCCTDNSSTLICAHDATSYLALQTGDTQIPHCAIHSFKKIKNTLGQTYDAVLIDATQGISASALAILAGTVRGNGLFAIGLPEQGWLEQTDQEMARYLPWPYEPQHTPSHFKRYFFEKLVDEHSPFHTLDSTSTIDSSWLGASNKATERPVSLSHEQATVQTQLLKTSNTTYALLAPRGRGKSTLLGDTLAKWYKAGKKVAVTAATPDAIIALRQQFDDHFSCQSSTTIGVPTALPFFAPDVLIASREQWDCLVVDEAARLPIPVLNTLLQKAQQCVFSTTDYGYEGAGKGFGIRFCRPLEEQAKQDTTKGFTRLTLHQPIRWAKNDPLEQWVNDLLFLCPPFEEQPRSQVPSETASVSTRQNEQWFREPERLENTFHLLANAHYQTSADNLRWILDDPSVTTWLIQKDASDTDVQSVAVITSEGRLPDELSQAILEGTRRPRGHLVPQSLMAHEGWLNAGQYNYWRISRIATQPSLQSQGLASKLLQEITHTAQEQVDFLSVSFAASPDVVAFWQKNGFISVRLGTTKDQASGSYSLMMVKPLTDQAEQQTKQWHQEFVERFQTTLLLCYPDLGVQLIIQLLASPDSLSTESNESAVSQLDQRDLALFCYAHRPFDSVRAQLLRVFYQLARTHLLDPFSAHDGELFNTVLGREKASYDTVYSHQPRSLFTGRKQRHLALKDKLKETLISPPDKI